MESPKTPGSHISIVYAPTPCSGFCPFGLQDSQFRRQHKFIYSSQSLGFTILRRCGPILCVSVCTRVCEGTHPWCWVAPEVPRPQCLRCLHPPHS